MSINIERDAMGIKKQFETVGDGLLVRAPGKINLSLLVKGKRPDGFHDIETIMAKINLYDEIFIEKQKTESRAQNIELICRGEYKVPAGEDNLVYKAAEEILKIKNKKAKSNEKRNKRLKITLTKNMPAGSGLGSGSSDAAATLMGLNKFFELGLDKKELSALAAKLGSDVSFFFGSPAALCTGRGEKVKKLERCEFRALLILPDVSVSTAEVYGNYRHDSAGYARLHEQISGYIEKKRIDLICELCANMLQQSCFGLHPGLAALKDRIESLGIRPACLSGSGSSMFCIINDGNEQAVMAHRDKLKYDFGCRSIIVNNSRW